MTDMTQAPTPGPLSQIPTDLVADTMNVMARAYERIHSMPRISDTELAIKVGEAKERLRPFLAPTAPVEASGSERESEAWEWLGQLYPNDAPSDLAYDANEMIDAFLAGSGRSDRMAKALERIAGEQQYRSGYCQTDITVEPALSADEAQTVAREVLAHNPALRPQPSGETREAVARIVEALEGSKDRGDSSVILSQSDLRALLSARPAPVASGGQHSSATDFPPDDVLACVPVAETAGEAVAWRGTDEFGDESATVNLETALDWGRYGRKITPLYAAPVPAQDDDKLRRAVEAEKAISGTDIAHIRHSDGGVALAKKVVTLKAAVQALASLKSTAAQEGGSK